MSYERSGENFGNTLIGNGIVSVLKNCEYIFRHDVSCPEEVNEKCDHILIPAANFLWKGFDFGYMADFINLTDLPVTIVGLGAQTNDRARISEIHPNTLRLIKIIAERSPSIGVRGFYTAEVLAANGIVNLEVLGCPSLYTNLAPPRGILPPSHADLSSLCVNFSRRVSSHSFTPFKLMSVENVLLDIAIKLGLNFIAQDELEELQLAYSEHDQASIDPVAQYFNKPVRSEVIEYFTKKTKYFTNVGDWSRFILSSSGTIGSRLHGNIISLINGRPGFIFVHDSRTLEVCGLTGMPYLHINDIDPSTFCGEELVEHIVSADYSCFESNMSYLFERFENFLNNQSLPHRLNQARILCD